MRAIAFSLSIICLLLTGCAADPPRADREIWAMDTIIELTAYGPAADRALDQGAALLYELDALLSVTNPDSAVSRINQSAGEPVAVPHEAAALVARAGALSADTAGALDITLYPLVQAYGFISEEHHVPSREQRAELLRLADWTAVTVSGDTVQLAPGMAIDLGAVAKGYASQRLIELLSAQGVASAIVSLGGNVQTLGSRPDGSPWRVAVRDPLDVDGMVGVVSVTDTAVVTSGGYQRYFEQDGVRYHHILDPSTGLPANSGLLSATVVCADGTTADGLSTALFVLGKERALELWRTRGDFEAILVGEDRVVTVTAGLASSFTSADSAAGYTLEIAD